MAVRYLRSAVIGPSRASMRGAIGIRARSIREVQAKPHPLSRPLGVMNARIDASPPGFLFCVLAFAVPPTSMEAGASVRGSSLTIWIANVPGCGDRRRAGCCLPARRAPRPGYNCGRGVQRQHMSTPCSKSGFESRRPHHLHRPAHVDAVALCCPMRIPCICGGAD